MANIKNTWRSEKKAPWQQQSSTPTKAKIGALGGKVSVSVTANTDCVVMGADSGSKAQKKIYPLVGS